MGKILTIGSYYGVKTACHSKLLIIWQTVDGRKNTDNQQLTIANFGITDGRENKHNSATALAIYHFSKNLKPEPCGFELTLINN